MEELSVPTSFQQAGGALERQQGGLWAAPLRPLHPSCLHPVHRRPGSDARTLKPPGAGLRALPAPPSLVRASPAPLLHM